MKRAQVLAVLFAISLAMQAVGHGWMQQPVPRSGGGEGTGNASTGSPCGKTGPTTSVATWTIGDTVTSLYKRANGHGTSTGANSPVELRLSLTAATGTPSNTDFNDDNSVLAHTSQMDTSLAGSQSSDFVVPDMNITGDTVGVLQFHWNAPDGSNWYDCAYIDLQVAPENNPCNTNNGGCNANATCTPNSQGGGVTCECFFGFSGDGYDCEQAPTPIPVLLYVDGLTVDQNTFTFDIARVIGISPSRILYDRFSPQRSDGTSKVYFFITSDDTGVDPAVAADELIRIWTDDDEALEQLTYTPVKLQVDDGRVYDYVEGGQPRDPTSPSPSTSAGTTAGIVIGVIVGVALLIALAIGAAFFLKNRSSGGSLPAYYPTKQYADPETAPAPAGPAPTAARAHAPAPSPAPKPAASYNRAGNTGAVVYNRT